jgi:hypothetical protein
VDFGRELDEIGAFLATSGFPWAVVGGVALAAYGHPRMAEVRGYFERHGLMERWHEIERSLRD